MHLAVGNQWGLIEMPMAQVKTIKKEEKCLTTPQPHLVPMLSQRTWRDGGEEKGRGDGHNTSGNVGNVERPLLGCTWTEQQH